MTGWHPAPARMAFRARESARPETAGMEPAAFPASGTGREGVPRGPERGDGVGRKGAGLTFSHFAFPTSLAGDR
jgi:hypothetical protein